MFQYKRRQEKLGCETLVYVGVVTKWPTPLVVIIGSIFDGRGETIIEE